jgi:2-polyprenyl-3-methyl-5-hydroxy-6-metoxy-1,4-benzoquinol methylase
MNNSKAKEVAERVANDVGGAFMMALAYIGVRLGLFEGLAEGPTTSAELATRLSLNERYVREWLKAMVANEYAEYDGACYFMTDEQRVVLADETSPLFVGGSFHLTLPSVLHTPRVLEAFRDGGGVSFDEMGHEVAQGIDRLHMPAFEHQLVQDWLAGVPGLHERLESGVRVLDAGCGLGRSSKVIARAYPASTVTALDPDPWSIARAREMCHGLDNVVFAQNKLEALDANGGFELILAIDCIHDMPNPVGALRTLRELLSETGQFLWVEPTGSDDPRENRHPVHRLRAAISPLHCLCVSRAAGGEGLGTIIGERGARRLAEQAGYSSFQTLPIENPMQQFFLLQQ